MREITTEKEKTKVYTYTMVSTAMQVGGYSLDAQKVKMKVDTAAIDQEIANYEKQLRQHYSVKAERQQLIGALISEIQIYLER